MNELPEEAPKESKSLAESSEAQRTGQTEAELNYERVSAAATESGRSNR
jgi:hypothetical protein